MATCLVCDDIHDTYTVLPCLHQVCTVCFQDVLKDPVCVQCWERFSADDLLGFGAPVSVVPAPEPVSVPAPVDLIATIPVPQEQVQSFQRELQQRTSLVKSGMDVIATVKAAIHTRRDAMLNQLGTDMPAAITKVLTETHSAEKTLDLQIEELQDYQERLGVVTAAFNAHPIPVDGVVDVNVDLLCRLDTVLSQHLVVTPLVEDTLRLRINTTRTYATVYNVEVDGAPKKHTFRQFHLPLESDEPAVVQKVAALDDVLLVLTKSRVHVIGDYSIKSHPIKARAAAAGLDHTIWLMQINESNQMVVTQYSTDFTVLREIPLNLTRVHDPYDLYDLVITPEYIVCAMNTYQSILKGPPKLEDTVILFDYSGTKCHSAEGHVAAYDPLDNVLWRGSGTQVFLHYLDATPDSKFERSGLSAPDAHYIYKSLIMTPYNLSPTPLGRMLLATTHKAYSIQADGVLKVFGSDLGKHTVTLSNGAVVSALNCRECAVINYYE